MAKSPEEMTAAMVANLKDTTGKTLDRWKKIVSKAGVEKHGDIIKLLKDEHGVTHGYANLIAHEARKGDGPAPGGDDLVAAQYSGAK